jgi:hypothetical protein
VSTLVSITLIVASKDSNVGTRDARNAVLARLKFRASVKQKSDVLMQNFQDQNSSMMILETSLSTHSVPASTNATVPVNRHLMGVSAEVVTLQERCVWCTAYVL